MSAALGMALFTGTRVEAAEYLTEQQIEKAVEGLPDNQYVLVTTDGGYIRNGDGGANFPAEQLALEGQNVMAVSEYKEYLRTLDISDDASSIGYSGFRAAYPPNTSHVLWANQDYRSQEFSAPGWRYGEA